MSYSGGAIKLLQPALEDLPRIGDRVAFLLLDQARVEQGRTGLEAWATRDGEPVRIASPAAQIAVLCLGPGTSITTPAMTTLARSGTVVLFTGADGAITYSSARPLATDGSWATAQARTWADPSLRLTAARRLYQERFPDDPFPDGLALASMRGLEGQRIKHTYRRYATQYKIKNFKRVTLRADDPVNVCLNRANALLYGVALAVTSALGLSPSLGFIHQGATGAFLYDLADVWKPTVSIPAAFEAGSGQNPTAELGRLLRHRIHTHQVLARMFALAQDLVGPARLNADADDRLLNDQGFVPGLINWHLQ